MVRNYTASQLLDRCKKVAGFIIIPDGYWLCFVRSNEDHFDVFDDKVYLFRGEDFIKVTSCTTNPGAKGLHNYQLYNPNGTYVAKSDQWNYNCWRYGLHRGKMPALRQVRSILGFRDSNRDDNSDEQGTIHKGLYGINFHTVDYRLRPGFVRRLIGGWSVGCFVLNNVSHYLQMLDRLKHQSNVSMCLLKEF